MDEDEEEIKKLDDRPKKISDIKKQMFDFIKLDDKKYILLAEAIEQSDREEAEVLERVFLKVFDSIKEKMMVTDVYDKQDLRDANLFLQMIKLHIQHERSDLYNPYINFGGYNNG